MEREQLPCRLAAARGDCPAELVLKNARIVNVFSSEVQQGDVAVCDGIIVGVGSYEGRREVELDGRYVCPGLIDGHIHIESSMLYPTAFARAVLPHGTTAVVTDPHEIANVAGTQGLEFMLEAARNLPLSVFFMLPSCVPATPLDESGAVLGQVPLPVAGLMSTENAETVDPKLQALKRALQQYCVTEHIDELMTLAFVSLPVIPKLRLTTRGVFDVEQQRYLPAVF